MALYCRQLKKYILLLLKWNLNFHGFQSKDIGLDIKHNKTIEYVIFVIIKKKRMKNTSSNIQRGYVSFSNYFYYKKIKNLNKIK